MTPYVGSNNQLENPCIQVSYDGINFFTPPGATNPLYPPQSGGYNSDVTFKQGPDGRLYMFFRDFSTTGSFTEKIKRMHSADGNTWSAPVMVIGNVSNLQRIMSPLYGTTGRSGCCSPSKSWHNPAGLSATRQQIPTGLGYKTQGRSLSPAWPATLSPWHMDPHLIGGQVVALVDDAVGNGLGRDVYLLVSDDNGKTFTRSATPLAKGGNFYRCCLLPVTTEAVWALRSGSAPMLHGE